MKKRIIVLLLFSFLIKSENACAQFYSNFQFGFQAAPILNFSELNEISTHQNLYKKAPYILSYTAGPLIRYNFHPKLSLISGYHLYELGGKVYYNYLGDVDNAFGIKNRHTSVSTIELKHIPAFIQYHWNSKNKYKYHLLAGTFISVSSKHSITERNVVSLHPSDSTLNLYMNRKHISNPSKTASVLAGAGIERIFNNGSSFCATLLLNAGFQPFRTSYYSVQQKEKSAEFMVINRGNFVGVSFIYFHSPVIDKKRKKILEKKL